MYYTCPYKFKLAYIDKAKPLPPIEKMVFGKTVHEIIARYYEIIPSTLTPREVPLFLARAMKDFEIKSENFMWILRGFRRFEERRLTWNLDPKPVAIEKHFERGIFHGIIDAIFKRQGKLVGIDWKSGRVSFSNVNYIIAGFVYTYIANLDEMIFVSLYSGDETALTKKELASFKEILREIMAGIRAKDFRKKEGEHCKTCEYSLACKLGDQDELSWH